MYTNYQKINAIKWGYSNFVKIVMESYIVRLNKSLLWWLGAGIYSFKIVKIRYKK